MISERINELFKKYSLNLKAEEVKFAEATLEDGTQILSDSEVWEQGVNVYILNDEGEKIPVPAGEYTLENGAKVILLEDGVFDSLVEVEEVEASADTLTREQALEIVQEAVDILKADFAKETKAKEDEINALKEELSASKKEVEKVKFEALTKGLPKAPKSTAQLTRAELSKMNPKERIATLFNHYK